MIDVHRCDECLRLATEVCGVCLAHLCATHAWDHELAALLDSILPQV